MTSRMDAGDEGLDRDGDDRRGLALADEVIDVTRAQRRVRGHENRADLGERELQDDPLGNVRRPDDDALARRDAGGHQPARDRVGFVLELGKREAG